MSKAKPRLRFTIDGKACTASPGQTILEGARDSGVYIPTLCRYEGLEPAGTCRVCTVRVGGRYMAACTQPVSEGMAVESMVPDIEDMRKALVEMLFVEGNHLCPSCEKSGNCQLQALAYRYQMLVPRFPYDFPRRDIVPAGSQILHDHNRCIKCLRCVRSVKTKDGKAVFAGLHRSRNKRIGADAVLAAGITAAAAKKAMDLCPVGTIIKRGVGFAVPIGKRKYDKAPIGSDVGAPADRGGER